MKVSVCCCVYNHEKYVRSALEGFVNQKTDFEYEVIVHDDASTDNSAEIIREYAEKYPEIIKPIYQTENQYYKVDPYETFILPKASGQYIAMCEGDDYWIDDRKLQKQVNFLDMHPDYVACVHNCLMENLHTGRKSVMYSCDKDYDIEFLQAAKGGSSCYQTASLMYRRELDYNQPDFVTKPRNFGDYQFAMHMILSGKVRFLNDVMSVYRFGTENSWTSANTRDMRKNAQGFREFCDVLNEVDEYTKYQYHEKLQEYILHWEYEALYFEEKYAVLRKEKYRPIYLSHSLGYRLKTYIKQYLSKPYSLYRRIKYNVK